MDKHGQTALFYAAEHGQTPVVKYLLSLDADVLIRFVVSKYFLLGYSIAWFRVLEAVVQKRVSLKPVFHLANLFARTEKKANLIGWQQTLTTSPANHIRFLLVRANKFAKWKTGLIRVKNQSVSGASC